MDACYDRGIWYTSVWLYVFFNNDGVLLTQKRRNVTIFLLFWKIYAGHCTVPGIFLCLGHGFVFLHRTPLYSLRKHLVVGETYKSFSK